MAIIHVAARRPTVGLLGSLSVCLGPVNPPRPSSPSVSRSVGRPVSVWHNQLLPDTFRTPKHSIRIGRVAAPLQLRPQQLIHGSFLPFSKVGHRSYLTRSRQFCTASNKQDIINVQNSPYRTYKFNDMIKSSRKVRTLRRCHSSNLRGLS